MKPLTPHDPLDDLIAAALHGDLSPEERAQFDLRLQTDPAARAAYQEAQAMHDLLEKTHKEAQPDPAFEQRMVSGVRRKMQTEQQRETAWESLLFFWKWVRAQLQGKWRIGHYAAASSLAAILLGFSLALYHDFRIARSLSAGWASPTPPPTVADFYLPPNLFIPGVNSQGRLRVGGDDAGQNDLRRLIRDQGINYVETAQKGLTLSGYVDKRYTQTFANTSGNVTGGTGAITLNGANTYTGGTIVTGGLLQAKAGEADGSGAAATAGKMTISMGGTVADSDGVTMASNQPDALKALHAATSRHKMLSPAAGPADANAAKTLASLDDLQMEKKEQVEAARAKDVPMPDVTPTTSPVAMAQPLLEAAAQPPASPAPAPSETTAPPAPTGTPTATTTSAAVDDRKLIRNAQLDLEVKSFQTAMDQITMMTRAAGGYVDTSNSQKGGNGKLQGTVVVKVLPQNLDGFLFKLRDLGEVQNQSVSTDDVTKDYFDTQARLVNSQKMETQLQDLLKRENGKVSDLLAVERELGRVRGDIEGMQGQLKLYDFQVQYATVTMNMSEKDLNQTAAYLLKEQDDFSLFATDVESTFQKARQSADDFKAQVLVANLVHNSGTDVAAELTVMVAPDQIEPFLAQVRGLGRVANFTRQTQRVAKDGGDSAQPADETRTDKDKVQVHLVIRSDDETRKQVALTVVAKAVDAALDQAKVAAQASAGTEILSSSLNKTPEGNSTAQLSVRVPGKDYATLIAAFNALGRTSSLSIQRNDNSGPGVNGDDAPVIVSLSLTDDDAPLQQTQVSVAGADVDQESQQIKKSAAEAGVEVKASSFERQPDGTELAQMTFRLPMAKYPAFIESVKALGKVESLSVHRDDRPDQTLTDDKAPAEISLQLHNQRDLVPDDTGLWATLRETFGKGASALFGSVEVIGVLLAFTLPWIFTLGLLAWIGRRIYIWRKK